MFIQKSIIPGLDGQTRYVVTVVNSIIFTFSHQFAPYSLLMYSINYTSSFKKHFVRIYKFSTLIFIIPVIAGYFTQQIIPYFKPNYVYLCIWVIPYVIFANYMIFMEYLKEKSIRIKQQKLLICIIVCPITILTLFINFIFGLIGISGIWQYQTLAVGMVFVMFMTFGIKYGVLGVKIKIEKYRIDNAFKAFSAGTAQLNHSIKNGILKITMCIDNMKDSIKKANDIASLKSSLSEDMQIMTFSADHLIEIVKRYQEQLQDIVVNPAPNSISELINQSLILVNPYILSKNINVITNMDFDETIKCDGFHLKEALINILRNSVDAMEENGIITIDVIRTNNRGVVIGISDNGKGISEENLKRVFEPFFSTKKSELNFGLGLFYCYNVMLHHGGQCDIQSEEGKGTSVFLTFNKKSVYQVLEA